MKFILAITLFIPLLGISQYDSSPQLGAFINPGIRDFSFNEDNFKNRFGLEAGLTAKHSVANGLLRFGYSVGMTYDWYKRDYKGYIITDSRVEGVAVMFRPEFRIINKPKFSVYAGAGPRFSYLYSFKEHSVMKKEDGTTLVKGWERKNSYEGFYLGIHAAVSVEYKFAEHWAFNLGLNAFAGATLGIFDINSCTGENLTTGVAYVF
ncbi:MAG: hypothetical protein K0S23_2881 [Fluviicola sp.]|jgi:hypothetical protein|uniref:outer membrane beta-barrel protein n=1 Tax=Fluviicola sp. TaxID=1917219 RepID=UPI00260E46BF|nr:outer membrane beta-barrel protein [Fluviicola sp.]MDF3028574.1 hypothetical protein [Fluviicola sp.]